MWQHWISVLLEASLQPARNCPLTWVFFWAFSVQRLLSGYGLTPSVCQQHPQHPHLVLELRRHRLTPLWVSNSSLQYVGKYLHVFPSHLVKYSGFVRYKVLCREGEKKKLNIVLQFSFAGVLCLFNKGQMRRCMHLAAKPCFHPGLMDLWRGDGLQGHTGSRWWTSAWGPADSSALFRSQAVRLCLCKWLKQIKQTYSWLFLPTVNFNKQMLWGLFCSFIMVLIGWDLSWQLARNSGKDCGSLFWRFRKIWVHKSTYEIQINLSVGYCCFMFTAEQWYVQIPVWLLLHRVIGHLPLCSRLREL